jgi:23S rRNA-/tRNA-specific pseudouridylate synthase/SAM-dependent methyltransferase
VNVAKRGEGAGGRGRSQRGGGGGERASGRPRERGGFGTPRTGPARDARPQRSAPRPPATLRIIHEDEDLLVVDKPAGIVTANLVSPGALRSATARQSLFDMVKEHVKAARKRRGGRVWIIHRLDKEASGLLVFAKSERAYNWLKEDFRAKRVHRLYLAVVEGEIRRQEATGAPGRQGEGRDQPAGEGQRGGSLVAGTIQSFIVEGGEGESARSMGVGEVARGSTTQRSRPMRGGHPAGPGAGRAGGPEGEDQPRLAVTHYRVLAVGQGRSLVQLRLETGRKNQIRVHMQEFGRPIAGDRRYGGASDPIGRLCLHATELGFSHPVTGQAVRFSSPAPAAFYRLVGMEAPAVAEQASQARIAPKPAAAETSWDSVAEWYDAMVEEEKSDHFQRVIVPGMLRLLGGGSGGGSALRTEPHLTHDAPAARRAEPHASDADRHQDAVREPNNSARSTGVPGRILDIGCGQGAICRRLAQMGAEVVGVDASPRLIELARKRTQELGLAAHYEVADVRELASLSEAFNAHEHPFEAAISIMALMNIDPLEPVLRGCASLLKPGGVLVAVILHPAFRSPRQTSWGWDEGAGAQEAGTKARRQEGTRGTSRRVRQYRRIDGYLSPGQVAITMNPGYAAHGAAEVTTWTFHRPLQTYIKALADAGFLIEALEEWPSLRQSQPGPRAAEENRARREIPMFLGVRALRR